jgi:hypothetical protein
MRKVLWAFAGLIVVALGALGGVLALDAPVKPPDIEFPLAWVPVIGGLPVNGVPCKHINLSAAAGCCLPLGAALGKISGPGRYIEEYFVVLTMFGVNITKPPVASTAVLPALAVAGVVSAAVEPDPIYAVIGVLRSYRLAQATLA